MSSNSGIQGQLDGGTQKVQSLAGQDREDRTNVGDTLSVGRGFSIDNSVSVHYASFHDEATPTKAASGNGRTVRLPEPQIDPTKAVSPEVLSQLYLSQSIQDSAMHSLILENRKSSSAQEEQGEGESSYSIGGSGNKELAEMLLGSVKNLDTIEEDVGKVFQLQANAFDVLDKTNNIKSGPPEEVAALRKAGKNLNQAMLSGDIEDMARILSEVLIKTQNACVQFHHEAIESNRLKRKQLHTERISKLREALEKINDAKKMGTLGKISGTVASALTVAAAVGALATGVGAVAGAAQIAAAAIMVTMTISENTGSWLTSLGGLVKDEKAQVAIGIGFTVLAGALSLGTVGGLGSHLAQKSIRIGQAASLITSGTSEIYGAKLRYEGDMYRADAHEDLALMTKLQMELEDWLEALQRALKEIGDGQQTASDFLSQAQNNKFTISRNI